VIAPFVLPALTLVAAALTGCFWWQVILRLAELARQPAVLVLDTSKAGLPPTLAIRRLVWKISDLTDDVSDGVKSATRFAKQVDQKLDNAVRQAPCVEARTRRVFADSLENLA